MHLKIKKIVRVTKYLHIGDGGIGVVVSHENMEWERNQK